MRTNLDYLNEKTRRIDFDSTNKLLLRIQEMLKHQEFLENRKKKINKLKYNINGKVHCL